MNSIKLLYNPIFSGEQNLELLHLYKNVASNSSGSIIRTANEITEDFIKTIVSIPSENGLVICMLNDKQSIVGCIHARASKLLALKHVLSSLNIIISPESNNNEHGKYLLKKFLKYVELNMPHILRVEVCIAQHHQKIKKIYITEGFVEEGSQMFKSRVNNSKFASVVNLAWLNNYYHGEINQNLLYTIIDILHPLYKLEQKLRNEVLLRPIGLEDHAWEKFDTEAIHIVAYDTSNKVHGCVLLVLEQNNKAKLIQMAVRQGLQKKGIGKKLVQYLKNYAKTHGVKEIYCDAREDVIGFYKKLGFSVASERKFIVNIAHYRMYCSLGNTSNK